MLSFWWPALLPLLRLVGDITGSSGEERAEKVIKTLGESVTFRLKVSEKFITFTLQRINRNGTVSIALLREKCELISLSSDFAGRLNVSEDCKSLEVTNLNQDDSGAYQAQIQVHEKKDLLVFLLDLHVYKRLSESDLSIRCKEIGNGTRRMNCSAGPWEDGVKFGMAASDQREVAGRTFDVQSDSEESDLKITCTAENPVSNASRTESLKEICDAEQTAAGPTTETDSKNGNGAPPTSLAAIVGAVVVLSVVVACGVALFWWKKRKGDSMQPPSSADSGGCNTIYARVGDVVEDRDSHYSQPRTQPSKQKPKMTIYSTVDHACKPNPLQTDDEKMQKGRWRAPEPREKTIYSEITTEPQEDEDQSLKTVYETVKNPKPPKGQEYDKII